MTAEEFLAQVERLYRAHRYQAALEFVEQMYPQLAPVLQSAQQEELHSLMEIAATNASFDAASQPQAPELQQA